MIEYPEGVIRQTLKACEKDLRARARRGIPEGEPPELTYLWRELQNLRHDIAFLIAYLDKLPTVTKTPQGLQRLARTGARIAIDIEQNMASNGLDSPGRRAFLLYRALTEDKPNEIPDDLLRTIITRARIREAANRERREAKELGESNE